MTSKFLSLANLQNCPTNWYHLSTSIQVLDNGDAKVVYVPTSGGLNPYNIYCSTLYANGTVGKTYIINDSANVDLSYPRITKGNGEYFVTWESEQANYDVTGQFFFNNATKIDNEFTLNNYTSSQQSTQDATYTDDSIVAVWESAQEISDNKFSYGVYGQRYFFNHTKNGLEFKINEYTRDNQYQPKIAPLNGSAFVVVWTSTYQDGSDTGIYGKIIDKYVGTASISVSNSQTLTQSESTSDTLSSSSNISDTTTASISTTNSRSLSNTEAITETKELEKPTEKPTEHPAAEETSHTALIAGVCVGSIVLLVGSGIVAYKLLHANPTLAGEHNTKFLGVQEMDVV